MMTSPRWVDALTQALSFPENEYENTYQLATVDAESMPHVRTFMHREILHPDGFPNLPVLLTTTDVRTPKVTQIYCHPFTELAWWMSGSQDQFRVFGSVRIVTSPRTLCQAETYEEGLLALSKFQEQDYDWERKRLEIFDSISSDRKAGWCTPLPGSVMHSYEDAKKWPQTVPRLGEAQSEEDKRNQERALDNFALVLIEPTEVDWTQLGVNPWRRTRFTRNDGEWIEEIIVAS
ncbi:hypothetical protein BKA93DRAFT_894150 [Sparassis latifolia]|uniref:Pyridoxamine 5'-phosphate oxidase Alr4036 family FMN-binding domain-containing protein n=1 Tax=Sparassis crispa TaxID=139825 RepID=A0A401GDD7_9APHY|nr:hypothetical protein SCP_0213870 [Sparassis crispa]GBE80177.1 hypothetical protein SCP_0213870 [Sparassis crispa]